MCVLGSVVNTAARLMAAAGAGILVDRATCAASDLAVVYAPRGAIAAKGLPAPVEAFEPLGPRPPADALADALAVARAACGAPGGTREMAAEAVAERLMAADGGECCRAHVQAVVRDLLDWGLAAKPGGLDGVRAALDAMGPDGMVAAGALARGDLSGLRPHPHPHVQMMVKVGTRGQILNAVLVWWAMTKSWQVTVCRFELYLARCDSH
jgi:hypothetical protein